MAIITDLGIPIHSMIHFIGDIPIIIILTITHIGIILITEDMDTGITTITGIGIQAATEITITDNGERSRLRMAEKTQGPPRITTSTEARSPTPGPLGIMLLIKTDQEGRIPAM